ncbi:MAG: VCBS repeat-containing protein [Acidobacteriota bacterium]
MLVIAALALPMLFLDRVPRSEAAALKSAPAPISAPPEPFAIHSAPRSSDFVLSALGYLSRAFETLSASELPHGLEAGKLPTFSDRIYNATTTTLVLSVPPAPLLPEEGWPRFADGVVGVAGGRDRERAFFETEALPPPPQPSSVVDFDFDNDGKADIGRWHSANAELKVRNSNGGSYSEFIVGCAPPTSGCSQQIIAPGDFNGDGKTDAAVFNAGTWTYKTSPSASAQTISWGTTGDIPVAGDYDGDGITDAAIYRPSTNTWWVSKSSGGYTSTAFGSSGDIVVPGDYDGDGRSDLAVYRPSTGDWHITGSMSGYYYTHWGIAIDTPVPADYDGDGKTDPAVFRPSTGTWYAYRSQPNDGSYYMQTWGNYGDQPVPGDYDGDNKADFSVWRPTTGVWYTLKSSDSNATIDTLGVPGDTAVPSAYLKQVGGQVTGDVIAAARLQPRNATGGTNLYSQNFSWGTSLVSLPGRSGLNAGFGISYNSLVWTKVGSAIVFDADRSNASPGFRFGFSTIEPIYYDDDKDVWAYMMITPSGGRAEFRQTVVSNTYETADSGYTQLTVSGATNPNDPVEDITIKVTTTDGTEMSYVWSQGAYRCTQIKDRNGNYISMAYDGEGRLDTMTDTLGRVVTVNYETTTGLPSTITQTWKDSNGYGSNITHTWATLTYTTKTVDTDFNATSVTAIIGPPDDTVVNVLDKITYPDGSSTKFEYNGYLQVKKVSSIAADSSSHVLNYVSTNLASPSSSQTDCPRFTETKSFVENFNGDSEITINNTAPSSATYSLPGSITGSSKVIDVWMTGHPDNLRTKTYVGASGWNEGLTIATEDCLTTSSTCSDRKRWTWTDWTQDSESVGYILNPRIEETRVGDSTNTKRSTIEYWLQESSNASIYGLVKSAFVYDTDLSTILKKSYTTYNLDSAYTSRRIIGLPSLTELYGQEASGFNLMSKVTYGYDFDDDFNVTGLNQNISPTQHDNTNYGATFSAGRGNLTSTTRWNVEYPTSSTYAIETNTSYNTAGAVVAQTDGRNRRSVVSYADDWNDGVTRSTYAYPTTVTDPGGYSSTIEYRFDVGVNVWARSPTPSGSGNSVGRTTSRTFDDTIGRLVKEKIENSGAYTRYDYPSTGNALNTYTTVADVVDVGTVDGSDEVLTETLLDGAGRVRKTRTENPNSTGGYSGKLVEYDILGRGKRESVPTEINSSWNPTGDDYRGMDGSNYIWLWNTREYDWKSRVTREINTDGTDKLYTYAGCGCARGQVTTIKGEVADAVDVSGTMQTTKRRTQKIYEDILGRTFKSEIWDLDGGGSSPYSTTVSTYNGRDQVTRARQYSGSDSSTTYQDTTFSFDGHGRLGTSHKPEQFDASSNLTYTSLTYNPDDTVATMTDPRGALTTYKYGNIDEGTGNEYRPLLTKILYSSPDTTNIPDPADVSFSYDPAGNRTSMSDGSGTLSYSYDELSRMTSETKVFADTLVNAPSGGYKLEYSYHLSGGIRSIKDPNSTNGWEVEYEADKVGRTTTIDAVSGFGSLASFATGISYRAFGGVKSMAYSTTAATNISLTYDTRLRLATYEAESSANTGDIQNKTYTYNNDGAIKLATNAVDASYSQKYEYNFASRLKKNDIGGLDTQFPGSRYKQTLGYDAFGNITSRSTVDDGTSRSFTAGYTNNRKSSGGYQSGSDTFDAAGNVVMNRISNLDQRTWKFDATGRVADWVETSAYAGTTRWDQGEALTFDGDGRTAKRLKRKRTYASPPSGWYEEPEYYIYSSVTGQKIIELEHTGQKTKTNIYMGSTVIAEHTSGGTAFKHTDPITGSVMQTAPSGEIELYDVGRVELEPLGAVLPTQPPEIQEPPHSFGKGGSTSNPETGCEWNGTPVSCHLLGFIRRSQDVVGIAVRFQGHENTPNRSLVDLSIHIKGTRTGIKDENGKWIDEGEIDWFWVAPSDKDYKLMTGRTRRFLAGAVLYFLDNNSDCANLYNKLLKQLETDTGLELRDDIRDYVREFADTGTLKALSFTNGVSRSSGEASNPADFGNPGWGFSIAVSTFFGSKKNDGTTAVDNSFESFATTFLGELVHAIGKRNGQSKFSDAAGVNAFANLGIGKTLDEYITLPRLAPRIKTDPVSGRKSLPYGNSELFHGILENTCVNNSGAGRFDGLR